MGGRIHWAYLWAPFLTKTLVLLPCVYATLSNSFSNEQNLQSKQSNQNQTSWRESERIRNWLVLVSSIYESWCKCDIDHCVIVISDYYQLLPDSFPIFINQKYFFYNVLIKEDSQWLNCIRTSDRLINDYSSAVEIFKSNRYR